MTCLLTEEFLDLLGESERGQRGGREREGGREGRREREGGREGKGEGKERKGARAGGREGEKGRHGDIKMGTYGLLNYQMAVLIANIYCMHACICTVHVLVHVHTCI